MTQLESTFYKIVENFRILLYTALIFCNKFLQDVALFYIYLCFLMYVCVLSYLIPII